MRNPQGGLGDPADHRGHAVTVAENALGERLGVLDFAEQPTEHRHRLRRQGRDDAAESPGRGQLHRRVRVHHDGQGDVDEVEGGGGLTAVEAQRQTVQLGDDGLQLLQRANLKCQLDRISTGVYWMRAGEY